MHATTETVAALGRQPLRTRSRETNFAKTNPRIERILKIKFANEPKCSERLRPDFAIHAEFEFVFSSLLLNLITRTAWKRADAW
jgi:hypothetical protein